MEQKTRSLPWPFKQKNQTYTALESQTGDEACENFEKYEELEQSTQWEQKRKSPLGQLFTFSLIAFIVVENSYLFSAPLFSGYTRATPRFEIEEVTILRNHEWEAGMSRDTNALWETGVPGTTGWVQFSSPRSLGLSSGLPSYDPNRPEDEVFIVTWGHQHHCLKVLRKAFWELVYNNSTLVGLDMFGNNPNGTKNTQMGHLTHCWDYLRQTISCQSDLTIESINKLENPLSLDVDGYNVKHQCKNRASPIYEGVRIILLTASKAAVAKWLGQHAPTSKEAYPIS